MSFILPRLLASSARLTSIRSSSSSFLSSSFPSASTSCSRLSPYLPSMLDCSSAASAHRPFSTSSVAELMRKPTKTKLKTHKGAAKRWLVVANGAFKRSKSGRVHLNGHLSPTRLNRLGKASYASPIQKKLLRRLMPYA